MSAMTPEAAAALRKPFDRSMIGRKPRQNKKTQQVIFLDYVGHAAVTDRLLQVDPTWTWEPMALGDDGTPQLDSAGGIWIRLTICGVTRPAYGAPESNNYKDKGDLVKEAISDAIKNGAMRYGVALDLWSKEDLGSNETVNGYGGTSIDDEEAKKIRIDDEEAKKIRDEAIAMFANRNKIGLLNKHRYLKTLNSLDVVVTNESGDEEKLGAFIVRLGTELTKTPPSSEKIEQLAS